MRYDAGVEEFLAFCKNASYIVTNSYHAVIFAVHFERPFTVFTREQCDTKIDHLLKWMGLSSRTAQAIENASVDQAIDYDEVHARINEKRMRSLEFLNDSLGLLQ